MGFLILELQELKVRWEILTIYRETFSNMITEVDILKTVICLYQNQYPTISFVKTTFSIVSVEKLTLYTQWILYQIQKSREACFDGF